MRYIWSIRQTISDVNKERGFVQTLIKEVWREICRNGKNRPRRQNYDEKEDNLCKNGCKEHENIDIT